MLPVYKPHFPFDSLRQQQVDAIEFAIKEWSSGKKHVILEMGTGCGKSAIGVCLSRYLRAAESLPQGADEDEGSWFLTTQKVLQEQYMKDFGSGNGSMRTIKSSSNYICQMFDHSSVPVSCAEIHRLMTAHDFFKNMYKECACECRYKVEKANFLESLDSLTNYPYFFAESNYAGHIKPRHLLIVDEAHTIEDQLGKFVEVMISEKFAKDRLGKRMPKTFKDIDATVKWIKGPYKTALKKKIEEVKNLLKNPRAGDQEGDEVTSLKDYAKKFELLDKHICKINRFLKDFSPENWVMNLVPSQGKSLRKLIFKPVDVSEYAESHLFKYGKNILMLSATILDKGVFCASLGLDPNDVAFLRVPSPFPVENRPIHYLPVGNMSKAKIDNTLPKMAEAVTMLLDQHPNEKGIIHCFSGETKIQTTSGISIPIKELRPGNKIVSWDEISNKFVGDNVIDSWSNGEKKCVEIQFENGTHVKCTPEHLFLTKNRGWVMAQNLNENDDIQDTMHDTYLNASTCDT